MPSTVIASYSYDVVSGTLTVVYRSGAVYRYLAVPEEIYLALKQYREKGIYLNKHIKGKFAYEKLAGS